MDEEQLALLYPESYSNKIDSINHGHTENIFKEQLEEGPMLRNNMRGVKGCKGFGYTVPKLTLTRSQRINFGL